MRGDIERCAGHHLRIAHGVVDRGDVASVIVAAQSGLRAMVKRCPADAIVADLNVCRSLPHRGGKNQLHAIKLSVMQQVERKRLGGIGPGVETTIVDLSHTARRTPHV